MRTTLVSLCFAASLTSLASAQGTFLTPHTTETTGATLGGTTFVNLGMVGAGRISGNSLDQFGETMGAASGLQITNWGYNSTAGNFSGVLNILPDRGYNAGAIYSNYAARVHQVAFDFTPYYGSATVGQTQLSNFNYLGSTKLTYEIGGQTRYTTGLNPTGTTTYGSATVGTAQAANGQGGSVTDLISFDAEALALLADGSGYVSDEYGPYLWRVDSNLKVKSTVTLPAAVQPMVNGLPNFDSTTTAGQGRTSGRNNNQGFEGIAVSPDGTRLFAMMQSALIQDVSGNQRSAARLYVYDISSDEKKDAPVLVGEYAVELPRFDSNGDGSGLNATAAQSELVAINNTQVLFLPRDGNGQGTGSSNPIVNKTVRMLDITTGENILGLADDIGEKISENGIILPTIAALDTEEVINLAFADDLAKFGFNLNTADGGDMNTLNEKLEGMSLVADLSTADPYDYFLFVANDNDFQSTDVVMLDADGNLVSYGDATNAGFANDATFYVFKVQIIPESASAPALTGAAALGVMALLRRRRA